MLGPKIICGGERLLDMETILLTVVFVVLLITLPYYMSRRAARQVLRVNPKFSVDYYEKRSPLKDKALKEQLFSALREAGLK